MLFSERINIALCFNDMEEAKSLSEQLKGVAPFINVIIEPTLGEFFRAITDTEKVHCIIIEEKLKNMVAYELVESLKKSQKYKKSVISVFTTNIKKIDSKYFEIDTDYIFDLSTSFKEVVSNLNKLITKNLSPVIPKDFNVMVLDNSPEILDLIALHLHELGHDKTELCVDIKDAKMKLLTRDYDLLLLDWNLDDGTCLDIIEFIKNSSVSPRTKAAVTVVITGRDDVDDIMTLLRYGIKDHIIKPFDIQEFEDKIGYALEKNIKRI